MKIWIVALRVFSYLCFGALAFGILVLTVSWTGSFQQWIGVGVCIFFPVLGVAALWYAGKLKLRIGPDPHMDDPGTFLSQIRRSLIGAGIMLGLDGVLFGSALYSFFVCPIWFLVAVVKAIIRRQNWRVAVAKIAIPAVTLALVLGNARLQSLVAKAHAEKIIEASMQYQATNGIYPRTLHELVPKYLDSVPRAKYAFVGEFYYWACGGRFPSVCARSGAKDGQHMLMWIKIPPFGRPYYILEQAKWGYLD